MTDPCRCEELREQVQELSLDLRVARLRIQENKAAHQRLVQGMLNQIEALIAQRDADYREWRLHDG